MISLFSPLLSLRESPVFWLFMTLFIFRCFQLLSVKFKAHPLSNPMVWSIIFLILLLILTKTPYEWYWSGGQFIHFLLGPATVALAVPLYLQVNRLKRAFSPLLITLCLGSVLGIVLSVAIAQFFDVPMEVLLSLAPRSVTTPVAMGIAEKIGGTPQLAASFVIMTGMLACFITIPLLKPLKLNHDIVLGFSSGLAAHGVATARVFQLSQTAGAFAGLAMGLNALLSALIIPLLLNLSRSLGILF